MATGTCWAVDVVDKNGTNSIFIPLEVSLGINPRLLRVFLQKSNISGWLAPSLQKMCQISNVRQYSALTKDENVALLDGKMDRHNGIHIHLENMDPKMSSEEFNEKLHASLPEWKSRGVLAAWLNVPVMMSSLIPVAAQYGFTFHHAEGGSSSMCCWLSEERTSCVPRFASHQVGVAGCVIDENTKQILMVQEKGGSAARGYWKFPGGVSELGEDISETATREVLEETGLKTEFQGILGFRQQHKLPNAFGRSDLFFVCHMKPTSFELLPDFEHEIAQCQWMDVRTVLEDSHTSPITHTICQQLQHGLANGLSTIHFGSKTLKSLYQGVPFQMYFPQVLREKE